MSGSKKYDFQLSPPSGPLPGKEFEEQVEKAINEVGNLAYQSMEQSEETLKQMNTQIAVIQGVANNALGVANEADEKAQKALDEVGGFDSDLTTIKTSITTINTELGQVKNTAENAEALAITAENQSNDNKLEIDNLSKEIKTINDSLPVISTNAETALNLSQSAMDAVNKISEYRNESDAMDLNEKYELDRVHVVNTSSSNVPISETGLFDVDVSEETEDGEYIVRQKYFSLDTSVSYVRIGEAVFDENTSKTNVTWGNWQSSGGNGSSGNVGDIRFPAMTVKDNEIKLNGALLNRADYPLLWEFAQQTHLASETDWVNNGHGGKFSTGDGSTTFRLPDMRGVFLRVLVEGRSVADPDGHSRSMGQLQGDAIRNFIGSFGLVAGASITIADGALFSLTGSARTASQYGGTNSPTNDMIFNPARVVPTGSDNRPINIPYYAVIRYK